MRPPPLFLACLLASALTAGCELVGAGMEDRVGDYAALALLV